MNLEKSYNAHKQERTLLTNSAQGQRTFSADKKEAGNLLHRYEMTSINPILDSDSQATWLTIGDGLGKDAEYIFNRGLNVVATDIDDSELIISQKEGLLPAVKMENAEALSFKNGMFDYVLCKQALHHFPRPTLAIYEMLRVAKKGIILIEPNDTLQTLSISLFLLGKLKSLYNKIRGKSAAWTIGYRNEWEKVGNYVYSISPRDIEKTCLSLGLPAFAFKGLVMPNIDWENSKNSQNLTKQVYWKIKAKEWLTKHLLQPFGVYCTVIFVEEPGDQLIAKLSKEGFKYIRFKYPPEAILSK